MRQAPRTQKANQAEDHDHHWTETLVPLGIRETKSEDITFIFGKSKETSDFIVDGLEMWWDEKGYDKSNYDTLLINLDNGKPVAGNTRRFIQRIIKFSKKIGIPIHLVYYPPYHSKYNPIERVWAALENYWKGLILDTVENTLEIAKKMTWCQKAPLVFMNNNTYESPIKIDDNKYKSFDKNLQRNEILPKWDIFIRANASGDDGYKVVMIH
ncbi:hypothetical protein [Persicobacter sp. CCB-QB2]|uniref:ISAzo13-like element transposase-related protein n=1 Tax=Persicobacter sp. CCB-QB2 TaxID=1561025 RepID=UPI00092E42CC|nr:hypothetical protein [Persicobacter sp. CCB-QB2]